MPFPVRFQVQAQCLDSFPHCFDAVHTGEDQPVVRVEIFKGGIERVEGTGLPNFDERNFEHFGASFPEFVGEGARLMLRAAYQDSNSP